MAVSAAQTILFWNVVLFRSFLDLPQGAGLVTMEISGAQEKRIMREMITGSE